MQWIWYLPSMLIGLGFGFSSGYWQLALISVLMVLILVGTQGYKNRYPQFDENSVVHVSNSSVAIGNRVLPRFQFLWKAQWHQLLIAELSRASAGDYFARALDRIRRERFRVIGAVGELSCWIGVSEQRELTLDLVSDGPHLIIVGPTGSGKSEFLRLLITSLRATQDFELALFDYKGGAALEEFAADAIGMATDLDQESQLELYAQLAGELARRERLFASAKCSSIEQYVAAGNSLLRLVVVVDEFVAALASGQKALATIEDIAARGRSLGVHLVAATQSLSGVSRAMLTNLRARVMMSSSDPIDMVQLGINPGKHKPTTVAGWASAIVYLGSNQAESFSFPLGIRPEPLIAQLPSSSEQLQPARSQALRQMYSSQVPELDLPQEPASNPDSQLLSRMARLHSSTHR
jgi:ABC-type transport system involved in cytochrome c biogenesis ATPase subunit